MSGLSPAAWIGVVACVGSALSAGVAAPLARVAFDAGSNGLTVAGLRCAMTIALLLPFLGQGRRVPGRFRDHLALGLLNAFLLYGNMACYEYIPVGLAALLFFTYPPVVAVAVAVLYAEPMPPTKAALVVLAFLGLGLILGVSAGTADWRGVALALSASAGAALNVIWFGRLFAGPRAPLALIPIMAVAGVALGAAGLATGSLALPAAGPGAWALGAAVVLQGLAMVFYYVALPAIGALRVSVTMNLQPMTSVVLATLMFGEWLSPAQLAGGAMVLSGVALMQAREMRQAGRLRPAAPSAHPPPR